MGSTLQPWVEELTLMQQAVLLTAVRGPDGITKEHPSKEVLRWYRRCVLLSAFDKRALFDPHESGGGSFTGPVNRPLNEIADDYFNRVDELPHHFQMHLMHAAQIVGYHHPHNRIRNWWFNFYQCYVKSLHLHPETKTEMDYRLGDREDQWRKSEAKING